MQISWLAARMEGNFTRLVKMHLVWKNKGQAMKRASYREAVAWIANNDGNGDDARLSVDEVKGLVSLLLIADIFDVPSVKVAMDVVSFRAKQDHENKKGQ